MYIIKRHKESRRDKTQKYEGRLTVINKYYFFRVLFNAIKLKEEISKWDNIAS